MEEVLPLVSQWNADFPGLPFSYESQMSATSYEGLNQQSEGRFTECLNEADMDICPDDMNLTKVFNIQKDNSEFCNDPPASDTNVVQRQVTRTPQNVVFKGRKSFIRKAAKLPSSIAFPFAFVKPSAFQGEVTLKDINQRISTPPPLKSKKNDDDPTAYPTSAFSGKPVVGKTKIRTGRKGSITIIRTKG